MVAMGAVAVCGSGQEASNQGSRSSAAKDQTTAKSASTPALPKAKKLVLKDGNFQLVREYQRNGDRVRYFSEERHAWEEIPAAMVDWDATAKAQADSENASEALVKKVHTQEEASRVETVLDVDASLTVAPGVFLPPGEGMFLIEGKSVTPMVQVGAGAKTDKKTFLKQVLSPIPIVPGKQNIEIPGAKAKIRIANSMSPEFYLREAPPDPDGVTSVQRSSRPGESGPEVELVHAVVKGNRRRLESIRSMFGQELGTERSTMSLQRWEVAATVYRFTLGEPLPPGEYALTEILQGGINLYVWDFGVDGPASNKGNK